MSILHPRSAKFISPDVMFCHLLILLTVALDTKQITCWIFDALVQMCLKKKHKKNPPCNFVDSGSCSCDTRKCLTPIVERQKVVLIPLWEGREGQGRDAGGGAVGVSEGWGSDFVRGISSTLLTVTQSQQTHRGVRSRWDYDDWMVLSHNGCKHWGDLLLLTHTEIKGDVFSLLRGILCHVVTCCL